MFLFKKILFFFILLYANFTFGIDSIHTIQSLLNLLISFIIIGLNVKLIIHQVKLLDKYMLFSLIILSFLGVLSIVVPYVAGTYDVSFFRSIFFGTAQKLALNMTAVIFYIRFFKDKATFETFSKYYILTLWTYLVFTFVFILFPNLKNFWIEVLYISELDVELLNQPKYATRIGLDGFAGFIQTFKFALGSILSVYFLIANNIKLRKLSLFYLISLPILTLGTLLYGRIGSVVSILAIIILILFFLTRPENINKALLVVFGISFIIVILGIISLFNESVRVWFLWAFELIISFIEKGEFSSTSTNILFERMYFIPDLKAFLIGHGLYTEPATGAYYMGTDVGFLRAIMFYGFIPTLLMYIAVLLPVIGIYKRMKNILSKKYKYYLLILLVMLLVVFEIKGGIYHHYYAAIIPFYMVINYQDRKMESIT